MPRIWLPTEGDDYQPEWGYLGGLTITEVTRELLEEIETGGNWRWDLVNDAPRLGKIYVVASVEPETQAMTYQDYGVDLRQLRVLAINGRPLDGDLTRRLEEIYAGVEDGTLSKTITLDLEKHVSIQLGTARLQNDMQALHARYPGAGLFASGKGPSETRASRNDPGQAASHRRLNSTKDGNTREREDTAWRNDRPASGLTNPSGQGPAVTSPARTNC
ncbi:MAG: hypothetical protein U9Q81_14200 [Pseudomonadota bacterium]|nr:hypothetical protein [Pseudomonadota bacterium]